MSRPIHEVKPLQARLVRSWETRLEVRVLSVLYILAMFFVFRSTRWPSGLRRQFKALVFGRGFESHSCHSLVIAQLVERSPVEFQQPVSNTVSDWSAVRFRLARSKRSFLCGGLAQTVERCVRNAEVAGSIPASSTHVPM